jgi:hypothetical protein
MAAAAQLVGPGVDVEGNLVVDGTPDAAGAGLDAQSASDSFESGHRASS